VSKISGRLQISEQLQDTFEISGISGQLEPLGVCVCVCYEDANSSKVVKDTIFKFDTRVTRDSPDIIP